MSVNPRTQWNSDAASVVPVRTEGYMIEVAGSGIELSFAPICIRVGPAQVSFSDADAVNAAEALLKVVERRRTAFAAREQKA